MIFGEFNYFNTSMRFQKSENNDRWEITMALMHNFGRENKI